MHDQRFPNESATYREARNSLLREEIELRRQTERVAELRRRLPAGGELPVDYRFQAASPNRDTDPDVTLSTLFGEHDTLLVYSFMYGPAMNAPCPSCSSIIDSLDGVAPPLTQRAALAVVARSEPARIRAWAERRGWHRLRLLSSANCSYNRDYGAETADGAQLPVLNVFQRRGDRVHHHWATELLYAPCDPGQDNRHVDAIWPLWGLLDLTPGGRGSDWRPGLLDDVPA